MKILGFPRRYVINGEEYYPAREVKEFMEQKRPEKPKEEHESD